jgi:hypothetical protein
MPARAGAAKTGRPAGPTIVVLVVMTLSPLIRPLDEKPLATRP